MKKRKIIYPLLGVLLLGFISVWCFKKFNFNPNHQIGEKLDSLNHVIVYYNGGVNNVIERNLTNDRYNLGLKYQCVEFVKRYYYQHINHKMPDSYGHAKDFFNSKLEDGAINSQRNLIQFTNSSKSQPKVDDLVIFKGTVSNRFGHVAIISNVTEDVVEIIQQNPGPYGNSRVRFSLTFTGSKWKIENNRILGWLRKEDSENIYP